MPVPRCHLARPQVLAQEEDPLPSGRCVVEQGESFFAWFDPPEQGMPMALDIDGTAEALKDDIWPNPMKFYTGEMGLPPVSPVAPGVNQAGLGSCMQVSLEEGCVQEYLTGGLLGASECMRGPLALQHARRVAGTHTHSQHLWRRFAVSSQLLGWFQGPLCPPQSPQAHCVQHPSCRSLSVKAPGAAGLPGQSDLATRRRGG